jgi:hypothetical protein
MPAVLRLDHFAEIDALLAAAAHESTAINQIARNTP